VDADERAKLTAECRALIEARVREPGGDDDRDDDDLVPLGKLLDAIRLGFLRVPRFEPAPRRAPAWLLNTIENTRALLERARQRHRDAPWASTEDDIAWGHDLRKSLDEMLALLDEYEGADR
jgi:hypothetical protein